MRAFQRPFLRGAFGLCLLQPERGSHSVPGQVHQRHRYQGWATGLGLSYGYNWILGKRWNLEATLGFGYVYTNYDKYDCATCGKFRGSQDKHYFGPTKAGISIIYMIK